MLSAHFISVTLARIKRLSMYGILLCRHKLAAKRWTNPLEVWHRCSGDSGVRVIKGSFAGNAHCDSWVAFKALRKGSGSGFLLSIPFVSHCLLNCCSCAFFLLFSCLIGRALAAGCTVYVDMKHKTKFRLFCKVNFETHTRIDHQYSDMRGSAFRPSCRFSSAGRFIYVLPVLPHWPMVQLADSECMKKHRTLGCGWISVRAMARVGGWLNIEPRV
jgi:hypothetical protein